MNTHITDDGSSTIAVMASHIGRSMVLRAYIYTDGAQRRAKMLKAREYLEGWCDAQNYSVGRLKPKQGL